MQQQQYISTYVAE
uniref:Uncharacterized protein n=1 Tax=Arundo donax TaxID=35708 RepID=A0A0A9BB77_ARUDO